MGDGAVIVAGSSGTLGSAVIDRLRADGWACVGAARSASRTTDFVWDCTSDHAASTLAAAVTGSGITRVHGLVWAAGTIGPIGPTRAGSAQEFLRLYLEHVVAFVSAVGSLSELLDRDRAPSVVAFSGGGATGPLPRYTAYGAAKAALVRTVETISVEEPTWRVNAVAPGFVASKMHDATLSAGRKAAGSNFDRTVEGLRKPVPPERAAALVSFLMSDAAMGISGRLISAQWDRWENEAWHKRLRGHPSLGRLRRVDDMSVGDLSQPPDQVYGPSPTDH